MDLALYEGYVGCSSKVGKNPEGRKLLSGPSAWERGSLSPSLALVPGVASLYNSVRGRFLTLFAASNDL